MDNSQLVSLLSQHLDSQLVDQRLHPPKLVANLSRAKRPYLRQSSTSYRRFQPHSLSFHSFVVPKLAPPLQANYLNRPSNQLPLLAHLQSQIVQRQSLPTYQWHPALLDSLLATHLHASLPQAIVVVPDALVLGSYHQNQPLGCQLGYLPDPSLKALPIHHHLARASTQTQSQALQLQPCLMFQQAYFVRLVVA